MYGEILRQLARRLLKPLGGATVAVGLFLLAGGLAHLIPALLIGYALAGATLFTTMTRLWRSADLEAAAAKRQMLWGLALRLIMLFAVLYVAIRIAAAVFGVVVLGFAIGYALSLVVLTRLSLSTRREI